MNYDKHSIESLETVTIFSPATKKCLAILDEIKDASLEGAADTVWSTGKRGRRLSSFKQNKTLTFSCNNGYIVGGLLAEQFGDKSPEQDFETATIELPAFEYLTVTGGVAVTTHTAISPSGDGGDEILWIYAMNKDRSQGAAYPQEADASDDAFAYNPATRTITLPTDVFENGDEIIVFYDHLTKGTKYTNRSDSYAGDVKVVFDYLVKDVCTKELRHAMFVMPIGTISDNFSLSFGNDMAVQPFSVEAATDVCSKDKELGYWVFPAGE